VEKAKVLYQAKIYRSHTLMIGNLTVAAFSSQDFLLKFLGYMAAKRKRKCSLATTDVQEGHDP